MITDSLVAHWFGLLMVGISFVIAGAVVIGNAWLRLRARGKQAISKLYAAACSAPLGQWLITIDGYCLRVTIKDHLAYVERLTKLQYTIRKPGDTVQLKVFIIESNKLVVTFGELVTVAEDYAISHSTFKPEEGGTETLLSLAALDLHEQLETATPV